MTGLLNRVLAGRYELQELLASAEWASVWRGQDLALNRPVAIKVLARPAVGDLQAVERLEQEVRSLARLAHRNIVAVYDFGTDGGDRYLVMEVVEGTRLKAMLDGGPLPVAEVVSLATQMSDGLGAAHAAGIFPADLRPANVIVTSAGVVKLCDVGAARLSYQPSQPGPAGRPSTNEADCWLAPEQRAGGLVDARADLYALGCTIHAMLTGAPPFTGHSKPALSADCSARPIMPLRIYRADVPPDLAALVGELLASNPAQRPADAEDVKARLAALSAPTLFARTRAVGGPVPPRSVDEPAVYAATNGVLPSGSPETEDPHTRGRRRAVATVVALAVALATAVTVLLTGATPSEHSARPTAPPATGGASLGPNGTPGSAPPAPSVTPRRPDPFALPGATAPPGANGGTPVPTGTSAAPAGSEQTVSPVPTAAPRPDASAAIADLRAEIQEQELAGELHPDAADDLRSKVDQVLREANEADWPAARYYAGKIREKLGKLLDYGTVTLVGYQALTAQVDVLDRALTQ